MPTITQQPAPSFARLPIKILQFGEGNFLRAFADYMVDEANEAGAYAGSIALVKPRPGRLDPFSSQGRRYTVVTRGIRNGQCVQESRLVTSVAEAFGVYEDFARFLRLAHEESLEIVLSNTTEAGIACSPADRLEDAPPVSFPAKLTRFLYERYTYFNGDPRRGLYCLPCELIPKNGRALEACVRRLIQQWALPEAFASWVEESCVFCDTLVDRIVSGYPEAEAPALWEQLGYEDRLLTVCEPYALWAIEDRGAIRRLLPLDAAGLPVQFVRDVDAVRERKTRLLNGAHTLLAAVGLSRGLATVGACMTDAAVCAYLRHCLTREILPFVPGSPAENEAFAAAMLERFRNPYLEHRLASISLNALSKWKSRLFPTMAAYAAAKGCCPPGVMLGFAVQLYGFLYPPAGMEDCLSGEAPQAAEFFRTWAARLRQGETWDAFAAAMAAQTALWGEDLQKHYPDLPAAAAAHLTALSRGEWGDRLRAFEEVPA